MIPAAAPLHRHTILAAILVTARAIVTDPARWCPCPDALDTDGERCDGREHRAIRWGALGALDRAAADAGASNFRFHDARQCLNDAAVRIARNWKSTPWLLNQNAAHRMTVAIFDEAIRVLPKPPTHDRLDVLAIARILIGSPDRWAQGAIALDHRDRALSSYEDGCRFCAAGALGLATHVLHDDDPARQHAGSSFEQAENLLDSAAYKLADYQSYIGLNEHESHPQVLAMFDHAIVMATPPTAPAASSPANTHSPTERGSPMRLTNIRIHRIAETDGLPSHAPGTAIFDNGRSYEFHANFAHGYGDDSVIFLHPTDRRYRPTRTAEIANAIRERLGFDDIAKRERDAVATFEQERVAACRALIHTPSP